MPIPTHPSNRTVIDQAARWGWTKEKLKRGRWMMRSLEGERIELQPENVHTGNPSATLIELYRKTGVTGEAFWAGPTKVKEKDIVKRQKAKETRLTQPVGDALIEAAQAKLDQETALKPDERVPVMEPAATNLGVNDPKTVTPYDEVGRDAIVNASRLPNGPSITNQVYVVLAKSGMPMTLDQLQDSLKHLNRSQISNAMTHLVKIGGATRVKTGVYQTKAAPVTNRERIEHSGPVEHTHTELVERAAEISEQERERLKRIADRQLEAAAKQTAPAQVPEPVAEAPRRTIGSDEIDELLDLLFPDGFVFKAKHLSKIEAWKRATHGLIQAIAEES